MFSTDVMLPCLNRFSIRPILLYGIRLVCITISAFCIIHTNHSLAAQNSPDPDTKDAEKDAVCSTNRRSLHYDSIGDAIDEADTALDKKVCREAAAIVYDVQTEDGRRVPIRSELHFVGSGRGGYIPGNLMAGDTVLRLIRKVRRNQAVELRLMASGFEMYTRRAIIRPGELAVWDDIILEVLTERDAATVIGRVWLEDDVDMDGMVIRINQEDATFTDESGYFIAESVSPGKLQISTFKRGYAGLHATLTADWGEEVVCELRGYRNRYAHVRWVYQPDGTRDFTGDVLTGEATLATGKLDRVSFSAGFKRVSGRSDFSLRQKDHRLTLRHFDQYNMQRPSHVVIKNREFEDISSAPKSGYERDDSLLRPGMVYVFRCYDGKHYAKMEILKITDTPPAPEQPDE